jgi:hypothetical protein
MNLLTKDILKKLPALYQTDSLPQDEVKVIVKFFNPIGAGTWYATEYDPKTQLFFGFANLGNDQCAELGYFSLKELEDIKLPLDLGIERDRFWDSKTTLEEVTSFKVR